jgi:hypothetical protein
MADGYWIEAWFLSTETSARDAGYLEV